MEQLWRSGALAGLVVTVCKHASSAGQIRVLDVSHLLIRRLLPKPGQRAWYADGSAYRRQLALFLLARVGGGAAAAARAYLADCARRARSTASQAQLHSRVVRVIVPVLSAAAAQLVRDPSLRPLLEAAAPALLPAADELRAALAAHDSNSGSGSGAGGEGGSDLQHASLELLEDLGWALDPLALGLDLPGCWNPACTSVAGASEADMKLKKCTACKVARWGSSGGPACPRHPPNGPACSAPPTC
jgi:hypothetical protein